MKKTLVCIALLGCMFLINQHAVAQLKIGANAKTINAPDITLLDLSVDRSAALGKGMVLPNVTSVQRDAMSTQGSRIPNGMLIYNTTDKQIQIRVQDPPDPSKDFWDVTVSASSSSAFSKIYPVAQSDLSVAVSGGTNSYVLGGAFGGRTITVNGVVNIVYNNVTLARGKDFTFSESTKTIQFNTLIPEDFTGFSKFEVEANL